MHEEDLTPEMPQSMRKVVNSMSRRDPSTPIKNEEDEEGTPEMPVLSDKKLDKMSQRARTGAKIVESESEEESPGPPQVPPGMLKYLRQKQLDGLS